MSVMSRPLLAILLTAVLCVPLVGCPDSDDDDAVATDDDDDSATDDDDSATDDDDAVDDDDTAWVDPDPVDIPPVELPDLGAFPTTETGLPIVSRSPEALLVVDADQASPHTAWALCADLVIGCALQGNSRDACIMSAPACATESPWEEGPCCPAACQQQYEGARVGGASPGEAFSTVMIEDRSCFPGLLDWLGGAR